ncbi:MAG: hypothetical protein NT159_24830 [Proteobacteria bacterium]|nr:hypothetical protein [Pseudomonadota bacterium]
MDKEYISSLVGRALFSPEDVDAIKKVFRGKHMHTICIVGCMGCGKTKLAEELSFELGIPHIELDQWHAKYMTEVEESPGSIDRTFRLSLRNIGPTYIVEHAELLKSEFAINSSSVIILLDPPQDELARSFEQRKSNSVSGDWKKFSLADLEEMAVEIQEQFGSIPGAIVYLNEITGTVIKIVGK